MKNKMIWIFVCLILCACNSQTIEENNADDVDRSQAILFDSVVSNDGIYNFLTDGYNGHFEFYDFDTEQNAPLCAKPNCEHEDMNCDAYSLSVYKDEFICYSAPTVYKNQLYVNYTLPTLDAGYICSMDLDGSNRKEVFAYKDECLVSGLMVDDKLYGVFGQFAKNEQGNNMNLNNKYKSYCYDLDNGDRKEISLENDQNMNFVQKGDHGIYVIRFNDLNHDLLLYNDEEYEMIEEGTFTNAMTVYNEKVYRINSENGTFESRDIKSTEWEPLISIGCEKEISFARINSYGIFLATYEFPKTIAIDVAKNVLISQEMNVICENDGSYYEYGSNQTIQKRSGLSGSSLKGG